MRNVSESQGEVTKGPVRLDLSDATATYSRKKVACQKQQRVLGDLVGQLCSLHLGEFTMQPRLPIRLCGFYVILQVHRLLECGVRAVDAEIG